MNKRILKKLCKRAETELVRLGYEKDSFFVVERGDPPCWDFPRLERKHRDGCRNYFAALPGTVGYAWNCNWEVPEYEDEPAYRRLRTWFESAHTLYRPESRAPQYVGPVRPTPAHVFRWATSFSNPNCGLD